MWDLMALGKKLLEMFFSTFNTLKAGAADKDKKNCERKHEYFDGKEIHQGDIKLSWNAVYISALQPQRCVQSPRAHYVYPSRQLYNLRAQYFYHETL